MSGFGIYVHWPFCAAKCPYCDFNSHVRARIDEDAWIDGILRELEHIADWQGAERPLVETIFFGGGTPSLMSGKAVAAVIDRIARLWRMANDVEITLESNPASAEAARFRDYRAAGVNRVSLGVQALNDADLKLLGRLHNAAEAKSALTMAMETFERASLDLIYARPAQTPEQWRGELTEALAFGTSHLSLYQLTIEQGTPFFALREAGKLALPDDDLARDLYDLTQSICDRAGLPAYEISNHAHPGAECRHNLIYWRGHEYAGIGPGAHGRLNIDGRRYATETEKRPEAWLERVEAHRQGLIVEERLTASEQADEYLLMGLRLAEGIDPARYTALAGRELDPARISFLREHGSVETTDGGRLRVTQSGFPLLDAVVADLAA